MRTKTVSSERNVRELAARTGYTLHKQSDVYGSVGYMLVDAERNLAILGAEAFAYSASLEDVEQFLADKDT